MSDNVMDIRGKVASVNINYFTETIDMNRLLSNRLYNIVIYSDGTYSVPRKGMQSSMNIYIEKPKNIEVINSAQKKALRHVLKRVSVSPELLKVNSKSGALQEMTLSIYRNGR